ncbi:MAG TPA: sedoheptulose 7-phosphate cyclase [Wenzhouxiangella sp.]|nr:sedoheptulose 7-phosphate cyclase [Wenzhouxiangella sp.]
MNQPAKRWPVRIERRMRWDVIETPDLFAPDSTQLLRYGRPDARRRFVVVDANVLALHGDRIRAWFRHHNLNARIVECPAGEARKNPQTWLHLARRLDEFPIHRRAEPVIAIGGGVLTDVVGFLAATYRRGIPHIKVPTTLMGYIDAALGIKNGISFNGRKNRLGSFEPPLAVLLDSRFLATQSRRHLLDGVAEILKLATVCDAALFEQLEKHGPACVNNHFSGPRGAGILNRAIDGMLAELVPNMYEDRLARAVDFGHTFSYGLETRHPRRLLHGEAVLLDMLVSVAVAQRRNLLSAAGAERFFSLAEQLDMQPDLALLDADLMWQSLLDRVEHRDGRQNVPLPDAIGRCVFVNDIRRRELADVIPVLRSRMDTNNEPALEY